MDRYIIQVNQSLLEAMKKIEENKQGFIIILEEQVVVGTITDGDIRRALIEGKDLTSKIKEIVKPTFEYLSITSTFNEVIEKFKSERIDFLPIVCEGFTLKNILTKNQLHELLLEGKKLNIADDFLRYEGLGMHSFEIFNRPWGFYKTVFLSEFVQAKIIQVFPKQQLSLQYHKKREEHWVIIKGQGMMTIGESTREVMEGGYIFIPKGCKHRIKNTSEKNPLIISEVQLGTYFGEDDIIRIEDDYNRV
ncbi:MULTISPECIES: CBS domain-containing protein [Lysinibacillus]|uniref:CBS domain-containing protein n=1 Tax=Lysinibacillus TaxID=400634 RepID=UPI0009F2B130|nr:MULTISPECIES: CBS domain-containing protein [Lysinibacillus]MEC1305746.1 cupin domain-containing protein [Lysinibacillus capsici]